MKKITPWTVAMILITVTYLLGQNTVNDSVLYRQAVKSAMYSEINKIDTNLVPINKQNNNLIWKQINGEDYILVVTWKQNVSYYQKYINSGFYNTGSYPIWVTTAPELLQRMNGFTILRNAALSNNWTLRFRITSDKNLLCRLVLPMIPVQLQGEGS